LVRGRVRDRRKRSVLKLWLVKTGLLGGKHSNTLAKKNKKGGVMGAKNRGFFGWGRHREGAKVGAVKPTEKPLGSDKRRKIQVSRTAKAEWFQRGQKKTNQKENTAKGGITERALLEKKGADKIPFRKTPGGLN